MNLQYPDGTALKSSSVPPSRQQVASVPQRPATTGVVRGVTRRGGKLTEASRARIEPGTFQVVDMGEYQEGRDAQEWLEKGYRRVRVFHHHHHYHVLVKKPVATPPRDRHLRSPSTSPTPPSVDPCMALRQTSHIVSVDPTLPLRPRDRGSFTAQRRTNGVSKPAFLLPFHHRAGVFHLPGPGDATKGVDEPVEEVPRRGTSTEPTEASTPGCIICCGRYCGTTAEMCPQCEGAVAGLDSVASECGASRGGVCSLCMGPGTPGTSICGACESAAMEATEQTDRTQLARRINFEGVVSMSDSDSRLSTTSWDVDPSSLPPGITPEFGPLADPKRYMIGREIGAGATARVFKCKRQKDGRVFAVKCLFVQRARLSEEFDRELDALHKEIGILSRLKHRNIVALFDVVETQAAVYIVMEYVGGGELFDYVVDNENFNNENVIRFVFCQVVDALLYLHVNGVIHRDLKPENILVSSMATSCPSGYEEVPGDMPAYPIVKLADFGLSKAVQNASSLAMTWVGTPQYWAPEVIKAQEDKVGYDGRADNWSLGVLLYVMLGKRYPFTGQHMNDQIRVGQFKFRKMDHVSAEAKDLVSRLIVVNPNDRISLEDALGHPWLKNFPPAQALQQIWVPESRVPQLIELYSTLTARAIGYEPAAPVTKTSTVLKPTSIAEAPSPLASFHEPGEDSPMTIDDDDYSPIEGVQVEHLNSHKPIESGDVTRKPSRQEEHHHQHASWAVQNRSGSRSPVSDAANRVVVPNLAANLGKKAAQDFRLDELCTAQLNILKIFQQIYIHFRHHPVVAQLVQAMIFEARELQTQTTVMLSRCGDIAEVVRKDLSDMVLFAEEGMPDEAMAGLDSVKAKLQGMSTSSEELHAHYVEFEGKVQKIIVGLPTTVVGVPPAQQREITAKAILDAKEVIDSDVKMSTDGPKISFVETTSSANGSSVGGGGGGDSATKRTVSRRSKRANERLDSLLDRLRNLPPDEKVISTADGKGDAIDPEAAELLDLPFLAAGYVGGYSQEHKKPGASSDESAEVSDKELDSPRGTAWATPERASKKSGEDESKSSGKGPVNGSSEATGQLAVARKQPNGAPDPTAALIADSMRKLRRIDQILHKVTVFWQGVDQSVAKLSDMRENAARLLAGTTKSARILAVFRDRAREYDEFWKTYEDVCKQYADASTRQMQAYLEDMNLVYAQVDDFDLKSAAAAAAGGARDGDASPPPAPSLVARQGSAASMRLALADATGAGSR